MASVEAQIKKQVEFYFSDSNFRRDRFLKEEIKKHEGGFIPFRVLFTFKKLAALTTDAAVLQAAVADSDVVELNEAKDALRRKHELPATDDAADRTLVLSGLGSSMPTIDEIKAALAEFNAELLYIERRSFRKKFSGVVNIEFKELAAMQNVQANAAKISILNHTPSIIVLSEYQKLSRDQQVEFEKSIKAMLVAKDVPEKPAAVFLDELLAVWQNEPALRPRVKVDGTTLYMIFTQVSFAERVLETIKTTPIVIEGQTLAFELVTDKDAIAARPRNERGNDDDSKKRKREVEGKAIHLSNIGPRVRMDDIKKLLADVMGPEVRSPYIEYDGLDTAKFTIHDNTAAKELFEKLSALTDAELGGNKVNFHLLEPNEELHVEVQYEKGLIVQFEGVEAEISRDDIKNGINELLGEKAAEGQGVAFIKYQIGDKSGLLRVTSVELAQEVVALFTKEGGLEINGTKIPSAKLLEGEEEKKFWEDARSARSSRFKQARTNKSNMSFRGGRGGRGGRGRRN